jgi:DNA replication protein DnaC
MTERFRQSRQASGRGGEGCSSPRAAGRTLREFTRKLGNMTTCADKVPEGCCKVGRYQPMYRVATSTKPRDRDRIVPSLRRAIQACAAGEQPWPLVMLGEAGSGKTCAGLCIVDHYGGWYTTLPEMCELVIDAQQKRLWWPRGYPRTVHEIWGDWMVANVTVLDEIGTRGNVSEHHYDVLKRAIDIREGRPAVAISNLTMSGLEACYDNRIASRLSGGTVYTCSGDQRMEKNDDER